MFVLIAYFGDFVLELYGKGYGQGEAVILWLVAGITLSIVGSPAGSVLKAKGKMWLGVVMNLTWGLVHLVFVAWTVRRMGAASIAVGFALAHLVLLTWGYLYIRSDLPRGMLARTFGYAILILALTIVGQEMSASFRHALAFPLLFATGSIAAFPLWKLRRSRRQASVHEGAAAPAPIVP
jgi:O-antigen/teichoic acid export membrane protein